ncbi:MAG: hypothetical protein ACK5AZ_21955 [Bryobacteraceae bacterium]
MVYSFPELVEIGTAHETIQNLGHKDDPDTPDGSSRPSCGDYEVDE